MLPPDLQLGGLVVAVGLNYPHVILVLGSDLLVFLKVKSSFRFIRTTILFNTKRMKKACSERCKQKPLIRDCKTEIALCRILDIVQIDI